MTLIDTIFSTMAASMALASIRNPRGVVWIVAIAAGYFASTLYWRYNGMSGELVTGLCDAAVAALVLVFGRSLWEMVVWAIFTTSLFVDFLFLANNLVGGPIDHDTYSIALEVLNAIVLVWIGGVSGFLFHGYSDGWAFNPWRTVFGVARFWAEPPAPDDR